MQCYVQSTTVCSTSNELLSTSNLFYQTTHCSGKWIICDFRLFNALPVSKCPCLEGYLEKKFYRLNWIYPWASLFEHAHFFHEKKFCHQRLFVLLSISTHFYRWHLLTLFEMFHYRHVVLTHSPTIRYKWYGGVVDAIYRARKGLGSPEEVKKQVSIVAYGINSATHVLELDPII